jgi:hypothetical protein
MSVFSQLLCNRHKENKNEYDKFKSENKFCIILKINQKACLTEIRGLVGPRASVENLEKRKTSCPCQESNHNSSVIQLATLLHK